MRKVMVFRHDNSGPAFRLAPFDVPDSVTIENVTSYLLTLGNHEGDVFTVVEVAYTKTYITKVKPTEPRPIEWYIEEKPEFSIFNNKQNGR